ncbi:Uncharacterised protein [[Clostridium] sordellii]|uniref:Uncharacterized protein n=1 Tax=Paraclostridium sordellii TaxID=1505 RepID=A0ABM9RR49_PARSO|nr:hypothetical protein ATCC9714_24201 [[Clostridium] sordellii] [Paeniclostridium sordellii]CEN70072.1 Uncharacterised protein [[Clostridium] sordellii] [Paeniclostridium sordellii]CEN73395.1 Uncharacterised protein [[Clostridium] sordellii] [Paeniclostridium sordellii]CEO04416.1 Uncharacterised protein [[Clostridium] sordellii] [Paeniclostridium sordellii]CEO29177.1 Uncharacterised protein [[Clostridium] sordellii] [Paeniclostridium sordellii]
MFKNQELLFGLISSLFILIHTSMYILQDLYISIKFKPLKLIINKVLPTISRLNTISLIISLFFTAFHVYLTNSSLSSFSSGYLLLLLLFLSTCTKLSFFNRFKLKQYSSILSYLLTLSLAVHIFFR